MKILLTTRLYHPAIGGTVIWADSMAVALNEMGHEICILTKTRGNTDQPSHIKLCRTSSLIDTFRNVMWSDIVIMIEPSITYTLAAFLSTRPRIGSLHTWYLDSHSNLNLPRRIQKIITHLFSKYAAPSRIIAEDWGSGHPVIPNGYDPAVFFDECLPRSYDFVFVGRFNHDKGPDLFVTALAKMHSEGVLFCALMIGDGVMMSDCLEIIRRSPGLEKKIHMTGAITDRREVARLMNQSKVLVVPNRWEEPFGMVFLEGLACGCRLVATRSGALEEVSGGYASFVNKGDITALIETMRHEATLPPQSSSKIFEYLSNYHWEKIALRYLKLVTVGAST